MPSFIDSETYLSLTLLACWSKAGKGSNRSLQLLLNATSGDNINVTDGIVTLTMTKAIESESQSV